MPFVGMRELARRTRDVIAGVERTGEPALITRHGRPTVAIVPLDANEIEDFILANAPEFVRGMRQADREIAAGRTRPLPDVMAELKPAKHPRSTRANADHGSDSTARSRSRRSKIRSTR